MLLLLLTNVLLPLTAAAIALVTALYGWHRRTISGAKSLVAFEAAAAVWLLCGVALIIQGDRATFPLWKEVRFIGAVAMPAAWWLFTCHFSGTTNTLFLRLRKPLPWIACTLISLAWLFLLRNWTAAAISPGNVEATVTSAQENGPIFWLYTVYAITLWSSSIVILNQSLDNVSGSQRRQSRLFIIGVGFLLLGVLLAPFTARQVPALDLPLVSVALGVLIITWTVAHYPVLETIPIARHAVFQSLTDGLLVLNTQNRVVDANPAACEILSTTNEKLLGRPVTEVLSGVESRPESTPDLGLHNRTIRFGSNEFQQTFLIQVSPLEDQRGVLTGRLLTLHDMTLQTRVTEALIEAKETAEAATHARSEFFAGMSHEIRTPINAVIGLTGILLETELTREQRDLAETIHGNSDSLLSILNNILDMSKIEAGQIELESAPFDLLKCLEQAAFLFAPQASMKGIELVYSIAPDTPAAVIGDAMRVRQVLINLIGNAVKFTEKGEVVVTMESEKLRGGQRIYVRVRDTGIGIPPDRMNRLFRSFSQVDSSIARKYGGSGLGLAISKRLADFLGGTLWAESHLGIGSTFHFTFDAMECTESEASDLLGLEGKHALVVDDHESARHALASLLTRNGMIVHTAASAQDALSLVNQPDAALVSLAVIDAELSGKNGDDLAARLLERLPDSGPSIILLAPPNSAQLRERFGHERSVAVLNKPVRMTQLLATAEALAISHRDETGLPEEPMPHLADEIPLSILLAEDNPASATITLNALSRLGYRADHVITGEDALDALTRRAYDVVLMDIHMPKLDGIEATRAIYKQLTPDVRPYIIALTASAGSIDRAACREAGMDEYLTKPLDVVDLAFLLTNLLPQKSA